MRDDFVIAAGFSPRVCLAISARGLKPAAITDRFTHSTFVNHAQIRTITRFQYIKKGTNPAAMQAKAP